MDKEEKLLLSRLLESSKELHKTCNDGRWTITVEVPLGAWEKLKEKHKSSDNCC